VKARLLREFKERHYSSWLDQPLPALDDKTPREASRTQASRRRLDVLLKQMENHEARCPETERFDFSRTRRDLGRPPRGREVSSSRSCRSRLCRRGIMYVKH